MKTITVVGNDVWIGSEAMIVPGISIGDGTVIGSRALVTKDVEPHAIVEDVDVRWVLDPCTADWSSFSVPKPYSMAAFGRLKVLLFIYLTDIMYDNARDSPD